MDEASRRIEEALLSGTDELFLDGLGLTRLPDTIGLLTKVTVLGLGRNRLTELPSRIGDLAALEELDISENALTALPAEVGRLKHLKILYLMQNKLVDLPREVGELSSLHTLQLEDNLLATLPPEIGNLSNLRELKVARNRLTVLPPEMGRLTKIRSPEFPPNQRHIVDPRVHLSLSDNPLVDPPPEIKGVDGIMAYLRDKWQTVATRATLSQYSHIVHALIADGGTFVEMQDLGPNKVATIITTRNTTLTVYFTSPPLTGYAVVPVGTVSFQADRPEVLDYVRAFLKRLGY